MNTEVSVAWRAPLLLLAFASMFVGMATGLARLGWLFPVPVAKLVVLHGPLMTCGFFGTVISLERAVALSRRWGYIGPLLSGLGAAAGVLGAPIANAAAICRPVPIPPAASTGRPCAASTICGTRANVPMWPVWPPAS